MTVVTDSGRTENATWAAFREFWYYFSVNKGAVVGLWVFGLTILVAIFAPILAPYSAEQVFSDAILKPPVWQAGADPRFFFGTDAVGRDLLSRLIHGSR